MNELPAHPLAIWESFYVIIGSSAAALTGLQFIVIAFVADRRARISPHTLAAFATPPIIHYCVVLFIAGMLSAPWTRVTMVIAPLVIVGLSGVVYTMRILHKMRAQRDYKPVFEDWLWHVALPLAGYGALIIAAIVLKSNDLVALFLVAGVTLLLMFIGIHAAWDTVTFIATEEDKKPENQKQPSEAVGPPDSV